VLKNFHIYGAWDISCHARPMRLDGKATMEYMEQIGIRTKIDLMLSLKQVPPQHHINKSRKRHRRGNKGDTCRTWVVDANSEVYTELTFSRIHRRLKNSRSWIAPASFMLRSSRTRRFELRLGKHVTLKPPRWWWEEIPRGSSWGEAVMEEVGLGQLGWGFSSGTARQTRAASGCRRGWRQHERARGWIGSLVFYSRD
jgi:hypothetical protein